MDLKKYEAKSITSIDHYECTLSDELKKFAHAELGETDAIRSHAITAMRDWIMSNPRIEKCRMDAKFLLRFLRFRKFSIPAAQEAFERYLIFREGAYGLDWFSNMDFNKPNINALLDKGLVTVLANRDKHGRKVILTRLAAADPNISTIGCEGFTLATMIFETLLDDEENQIRGMNYILDVSNIKLRHYFIFSFMTWYKLLKNIEKTCTVRHKGFHVVKIHPTLKFVSKLALKHMPEKLRKRVRFHSNFDEVTIFDRKDFPVECGGNIELNELIEPWREILNAKKEFFLNYNNMKVNRSFYSASVLNCNVETLTTSLQTAFVINIEKIS